MEDTKSRILKSALESFSKNGFNGATTRDIARVAGVNEVTLFRYFSSKEKLFENMVNEFLPNQDFVAIVHDAKQLPYKESLTLIANAFIDGLKQHHSLIQVLYMEYQQHWELMEKVYGMLVTNLTKILAGYFQELQLQGVVRPINPALCAKMFFSIWMDLYDEEYVFKMGLNASELDETISVWIDIFARGTSLQPL